VAYGSGERLRVDFRGRVQQHVASLCLDPAELRECPRFRGAPTLEEGPESATPPAEPVRSGLVRWPLASAAVHCQDRLPVDVAVALFAVERADTVSIRHDPPTEKPGVPSAWNFRGRQFATTGMMPSPRPASARSLSTVPRSAASVMFGLTSTTPSRRRA